MVECTALEMRHTCKGIVGSNPTLSAIFYKYIIIFNNLTVLAHSSPQNNPQNLMVSLMVRPERTPTIAREPDKPVFLDG